MSGTTSSSYFESSFDYRSLLPTTSHDSSLQGYDDTGNYNDQQRDSDNDDDLCSCLPAMTWRERLLGCATCMIAGYLLSLGSFWRIKDLVVHHDPMPFVINVTLGNILALMGSFFLSGPRTQWNNMWLEKRRTATGLYLGSLCLTLVVAFFNNNIPGPTGLYLLILVLCQYVAITWYTLSYIPFAQDMVAGFLRRRLGSGDV